MASSSTILLAPSKLQPTSLWRASFRSDRCPISRNLNSKTHTCAGSLANPSSTGLTWEHLVCGLAVRSDSNEELTLRGCGSKSSKIEDTSARQTIHPGNGEPGNKLIGLMLTWTLANDSTTIDRKLAHSIVGVNKPFSEADVKASERRTIGTVDAEGHFILDVFVPASGI